MTDDTRNRRDRRAGHGFLALMRVIERKAADRPRIGQSRRLREEVVALGQDPYLGFADSDLSDVDLDSTPPKVRPRFLGFFGPFGALPISTTREAARWAHNGHHAFVHFTDILVTRFIQLFYRSWSDARPITQFDHPSGGSFPDHLRAFTGDAGPAHAGRGAIDDITRLRYTALTHGRVRSPVRLRKLLQAHFKTHVRVEEFVTDWLEFAPDDLSLIGFQGSSVGRDLRLGRRLASVGEKITIHIECRDLGQYESFLPGRPNHRGLADLVLGYVGAFFSVDVALWLPQDAVVPASLGRTTELGWMSALPTRAVATQSQATDGTKMIQACRYGISMP